MAGRIYLVATPIGNLSDMTFRAIDTLKKVDLIAAEDTRQTLKLLNHFEISKPMISYHRHNEDIKSECLIEKVLAGKNIAIVTDAGTTYLSFLITWAWIQRHSVSSQDLQVKKLLKKQLKIILILFQYLVHALLLIV